MPVKKLTDKSVIADPQHKAKQLIKNVYSGEFLPNFRAHYVDGSD